MYPFRQRAGCLSPMFTEPGMDDRATDSNPNQLKALGAAPRELVRVSCTVALFRGRP